MAQNDADVLAMKLGDTESGGGQKAKQAMRRAKVQEQQFKT